MLAEYYFLLAIIIGLALGIFAMILFFHYRRSKSIQATDKLNVEERISPFIKVHRSLLVTPDRERDSESTEALKRKIEGFKNRNRFYKF